MLNKAQISFATAIQKILTIFLISLAGSKTTEMATLIRQKNQLKINLFYTDAALGYGYFNGRLSA